MSNPVGSPIIVITNRQLLGSRDSSQYVFALLPLHFGIRKIDKKKDIRNSRTETDRDERQSFECVCVYGCQCASSCPSYARECT